MPRRYTDYIDNRPSARDSHPHQLQIFLASLPELSVGYLTLRYGEAVRDAKSFGSHMREAELNDSMKVACVGVWLFFFKCREMKISQTCLHVTNPVLPKRTRPILICCCCHWALKARELFQALPHTARKKAQLNMLPASNISFFWRFCGLTRLSWVPSLFCEDPLGSSAEGQWTCLHARKVMVTGPKENKPNPQIPQRTVCGLQLKSGIKDLCLDSV